MADRPTCLELAMEGERLCKKGDIEEGIGFLERAIAERTTNLQTLSAIYSQLGNAYFSRRDYVKALEYHRHDHKLASTIGDRRGEAKASGNLGNTLKQLGMFDEAIMSATKHLSISRDLDDRVSQGRALYNLGNIFHAKGKHLGRSLTARNPASPDTSLGLPGEVREALELAVEHFDENLRIVTELGDKAGMGRAFGNLGNTHYLLGQFNKAIKFHQARLELGKEFGDKAAMRRAYTNLGNSYVFLAEFPIAAECYRYLTFRFPCPHDPK